LAIARVVDAVADDIGASSAQVALAWVRERGTIPIIGVRTLAQLQDNLGSLSVTLGLEHLAQLDAASAIELGHPYDFFSKDLVKALGTGGMGDLIDNHRECR
jgi:aryl-alcohol dehydrogenase-like predicted oxidoreductase